MVSYLQDMIFTSDIHLSLYDEKETTIKKASIVYFIYMKLTSKHDIWSWIKDGIIPNIYPSTQYSGITLTIYEKQFLANADGLRLTNLQLYQQRMQKGKFNCT